MRVLAMLLAFAASPALAEGLVPQFPAAEDACFGRVDGPADLARAPGQSITELYVGRLLTPDPEREDEAPNREASVAAQAAPEREQRSISLELYARLREPRRVVSGAIECFAPDAAGAVRCGVDCDGGGLTMRPDGDGLAVTFDRHGVRVAGACGEGRTMMLGARPADRTLRVAPMPVASCVAAREAARPHFVRHGPPLRLAVQRAGGTACFARRYDAAHLARQPRQRVVALALRVGWRAAGEDLNERLEGTLTTRLKNGAVRRANVQCFPSEYSFQCSRPGQDGGAELTRGPGGGAILRLPADEPGERGGALRRLGALLGAELGDQDDVFRLDLAPEGACGG
jgi:hypothetical protein